jgi:hypothetical protein
MRRINADYPFQSVASVKSVVPFRYFSSLRGLKNCAEVLRPDLVFKIAVVPHIGDLESHIELDAGAHL